MKFVALGDSHGLHHNILMPPNIDLAIFTGDITQTGTLQEVKSFIDWLKKIPLKYKIVIAGNHDLCLENKSINWKKEFANSDITYLLNEIIEIDGIKLYGSPYTPQGGDFAFQKTAQELKHLWQQLSLPIDILITHGPPYGILDITDKKHLGDISLYHCVERLTPRIHIFGHVHSSFGQIKTATTTFLNVSCKRFLTEDKFTPKVWEI